jgi:hypothetical protein
MFENDLEDLVSVEGVVHLATTLGVFLDIQDRRIFVPVNCMETPSQVRTFKPGEIVTLQVVRRYAEQEGFVAHVQHAQDSHDGCGQLGSVAFVAETQGSTAASSQPQSERRSSSRAGAKLNLDAFTTKFARNSGSETEDS